MVRWSLHTDGFISKVNKPLSAVDKLSIRMSRKNIDNMIKSGDPSSDKLLKIRDDLDLIIDNNFYICK